MYAHEVIEDLKKRKYKNGAYAKVCLETANQIEAAQKFHLGAGFEYYKFIDLKGDKKQGIVAKDYKVEAGNWENGK